MKNCFFFTLLIMIGLSSCSKDRGEDPTVLPDATQTGANTGGALVNGAIWVAKIEQPDLYPGGNNTQYEHVNGEYRLQIVLRNFENPSGNSILIKITSTQDIVLGDYQLFNTDNNRGTLFMSPVGYSTDNNNTGLLTITKFDKINKIVSGTFSFKAVDGSGKIINIILGRFDKKFL